jgi:hypothetical protein
VQQFESLQEPTEEARREDCAGVSTSKPEPVPVDAEKTEAKEAALRFAERPVMNREQRARTTHLYGFLLTASIASTIMLLVYRVLTSVIDDPSIDFELFAAACVASVIFIRPIATAIRNYVDSRI